MQVVHHLRNSRYLIQTTNEMKNLIIAAALVVATVPASAQQQQQTKTANKQLEAVFYDENGKVEPIHLYMEPVDKSDSAVFKRYLASAAQGIASSEYHLGECYEFGLGVAKDSIQAFHWMDKAAMQGYALAQSRLSAFYDMGYGTKKDSDKAMTLNLKAAQQGLDEAQYCLGVNYYYGYGVKTDKKKGLYWPIRYSPWMTFT